MTALAIGSVRLGGGVPCAVLSVWDGALLRRRRAGLEGVELLEARVDRFDRIEVDQVVKRIAAYKRLGLPLIGTVRSRREGGRAKIPDRRRLELYEAIAPLVEAVDVELRSVSIVRQTLAAARRHRCRTILSYHDFLGTPPTGQLEAILRQALSLRPDIVKLATMGRQPSDVSRLLEFTLRHRARPLVTIAMGPLGSISRLAFPLAGSLLTYTALSPSDGQLPLREFLAHLRCYYPKLRARP